LTECTEWRFPWLIALCICLGILLLAMLILNIFLCSSLSCTCTKTEIVDREPSEDEYDPYNKVDWPPPQSQFSHYGSRSSLNKPPMSYANAAGSGHGSGHESDGQYYPRDVTYARPQSRFSAYSGRHPIPEQHPAQQPYHLAYR